MALFFDAEWFEARLAAAGLTRAVMAQALGLSEQQIAEVWKDQREISAREVSTMAALLGVSPEDVAKHAGISTPVPKPASELDDIRARLDRIEQTLAELKASAKR
ncbi:MAG TPA: helix-turn-helix transcriptional regulator [Rhizomicrobium sp.]|jgi:transcriptional regulator with XRE-family HTH domain